MTECGDPIAEEHWRHIVRHHLQQEQHEKRKNRLDAIEMLRYDWGATDIDLARRRLINKGQDPETFDTFRSLDMSEKDNLFGEIAEIAFERLVLEETFEDAEWRSYDDSDFDYILYPDSFCEVTVDVKARILPRQEYRGVVDMSEEFPWYTDLLARETRNGSSSVYVQVIVTEQAAWVTGWAKDREVKQYERLWHLENDPYGMPQDDLRPISSFGGGAL